MGKRLWVLLQERLAVVAAVGRTDHRVDVVAAGHITRTGSLLPKWSRPPVVKLKQDNGALDAVGSACTLRRR